jgi:rubrerythrin
MRLKREELFEYSRSIIDVEQKSRTMYENYLETIEDEDVRETLKGILKDEIGHIELAKHLLLVLEE